ncbi:MULTISPECIES: L7Ae/L30e/S12e/Gadd45 family ribosomal protein [Ruminococcus]|uniref:Ribosomal protein L7Ae n=1 Tax=Ruminococcus flavefaciens TaxID=1265 RepID=A0A1M7L816_RUMFL|nr:MULTISPECIES: ribosomal L7Ae/L30e/S12e/Gadd45 family protein [Ruminococcus]MCR4796714.1 ribosomal L7Ae/L30e/S12e/Gadd45 family protein [Ruminococcus sp.]SHM74036.1 Ribosomal protein L7Ae [Ruminococcus flavefaciens]
MSSEKSRRTANLLGICIRAGKTVKGFDSAVEAVKNGIAFCLLTASDASEKTVKEVRFYCEKYGVKALATEMRKADIGRLCGKETAVIAVTDKGFADGFERIISD